MKYLIGGVLGTVFSIFWFVVGVFFFACIEMSIGRERRRDCSVVKDRPEYTRFSDYTHTRR